MPRPVAFVSEGRTVELLDDRVRIQHGFRKKSTMEIMLSQLTSVELKQGILGKGYVRFYFSGGGDEKYEFPWVARSMAERFKVAIDARLNELRAIRTADVPRSREVLSGGESETDLPAQLKRLGDLREQGILSDEEFQAAKRKLLS